MKTNEASEDVVVEKQFEPKLMPRPQTSQFQIALMAEEGAQPRPKSLDDSTRAVSLADLAADSRGLYVGRGLMLSVDALAAFGHFVTNPFCILELGVKLIATQMGKMWSSIDSTNTDGRTGMSRADTGKAWSESAQKALSSIAEPLEKVMASVGYLQLATFFTNAAYDNMFPPAYAVLSSQSFNSAITNGIEAQIAQFLKYNTNMNTYNGSCDPTKDTDCPYAYAQYPFVVGPLDTLGMNDPGFKGDAYYNQVRIHTMINAVMEKILRDPTQPFMSKMIKAIGQTKYDSVISAPDETLINYIHANFDGNTYDTMYGIAFTAICSQYNGITYTDNYVMGPYALACPHSSNVAGTCSYTQNRKRFQCGYNQTDCVNWSSTWTNNTYGNYAEWFSPTDMSTYMTTAIQDDSDPGMIPYTGQGSATYPNFSPVSAPLNIQTTFKNQGGACIVTSPTAAQLCTKFGGNYSPTTHNCTFTPQFCQSIGTCYCTFSQSCFLPTDIMNGVAFLFGQNGPREWIYRNGCIAHSSTECTPTTASDYSIMTNAMGITNMFADAIANAKNWGPALKEELKNPVGALSFVGAVQAVAQLQGVTINSLYTAVQNLKTAVVEDVGGGGVGGALADASGAAGDTLAAAEAAESAGAQLAANADIIVMAAVIVTTVALSISEMIQANIQHMKQASNDGQEYTVGGWKMGNSQYVASRLGFTPGWYTEPILYHPIGQITNPYSTVDSFGYGTMPFWDPTFNWNSLPYSSGTSLSCTNACAGCGTDHSTSDCVTCRDYYRAWDNTIDTPLLTSCPTVGNAANDGRIQSRTNGADIAVLLGSAKFNVAQQVCYQNWGNPVGVHSPSNFTGTPIWIRAATDPGNNKIWCIPPFPVTKGTNPGGAKNAIDTTGLFDTTHIGVPAQINTPSLTNNTWTDATDSNYPSFPRGSLNQQGTSGSSALWYYQLVYDKDKMVGVTNTVQSWCIATRVSATCNDSSDSNTASVSLLNGNCVSGPICPNSGVQVCAAGYSKIDSHTCQTTTHTSNVYTLPEKLWDTAYLEQYFSASTITSMRKYFCNNQIQIEPTGSTLDTRCWGYLSFLYNGWQFIPSTLPPS